MSQKLWSVELKIQASEKMDETNEVTLHALTPNDLEDVLNLVKRTYFGREVLNKTMNSIPDEMLSDMSPHFLKWLENGACFGLRSKTTKELVGIKLNSVLTRGEPTFKQPPKYKHAMQMKRIVESLPPPEDLFNQDPQLQKILHGRLLNIDPSYCGQNLAKILFEASEEAGIKLGCQLVYAEVGDEQHLKNMNKNGYKILHQRNLDEVMHKDKPVIDGSSNPGLLTISSLVKNLTHRSYNLKSSL